MILLSYDTARFPSLLPSLTALDNQPIKLKELANNSLPLLPEKKKSVNSSREISKRTRQSSKGSGGAIDHAP